jgi:hypothetical protein
MQTNAQHAAGAAPLPPTATTAVPTYDASRNITIKWTDNSLDETGFTVERSVNGGLFAPFMSVGSNTTSLVDTSVKSLSDTYTYRVFATNNDGDSTPSSPFGGGIAVTWPLANASHQLMQGFADGSANSALKIHEGLDIFATGTLSTVAARSGKVVEVNTPPVGNPTQGYVTVEVDTGGGNKEYDLYIHVNTIGVAVNDVVPEGKVLATQIAQFDGTGTSDHLHFSVMRNTVGSATTNSAFEKLWLNPLARFTKAADRDPLQKTPGLFDSNGDGRTVILTPSGQTTPPGNFQDKTTNAVQGDIDIIADVRDQMNNTFRQASAPNKVGYHVKGLFNQGVTSHSVRTAADPYILATFDDNWFNDRPFFNNKFTTVYADDGTSALPTDAAFDQLLRIPKTNNNTLFPFTKQYTVTNTKGNDGRVANVDTGQYWNTNAKDISARSDTNAAANFAGDPDATKNAEARFKDGDYEVHIISADLVNTADSISGKYRLDNWGQTALPGHGGAAPPAPAGTPPLYDISNTSFLITDLLPEVANVNDIFNLGDHVGASGTQYYPDLLMQAYIFPHQTEWFNGDLLIGSVADQFVLSDSNGQVALTDTWVASQTGTFDLIIDYDRDGKFSATLDGLGGFEVVPEPAIASMLAAAGLLLGLRRKRMSAARIA